MNNSLASKGHPLTTQYHAQHKKVKQMTTTIYPNYLKMHNSDSRNGPERKAHLHSNSQDYCKTRSACNPAPIGVSEANKMERSDRVHLGWQECASSGNLGITTNKNKGVTLIELLIVITILGVLAATAYPSYQQHIINAHRSDAKSALKGLALALEDHRTVNFTYSGAADDGAGNPADTGAPLIYYKTTPLQNTSKIIYNLNIDSNDGNSYTITASPNNPGINATNGKLSLNSQGTQQWDRNNDGDYADPNENYWE